MYPPITIVIMTYERHNLLRQTLDKLHEHLFYSGKTQLLIADDASPTPYGSAFEGLRIITTPTNGGWGYNANFVMRHIKTNIVLHMEDDYWLEQFIDITPYVCLLDQYPDVGLVRLDGIAGHHVNAGAKEYKLKPMGYQQSSGSLPDTMYGWSLDVASPETWLYSNRPHLKHQRFMTAVGEYPEGLKLGHTEESYAHMVKDYMRQTDNPLKIMVPMDLCLPHWSHVGKSYQHTEHDKGREN